MIQPGMQGPLERLTLRTSTLAVEILPALGGKIASLRYEGVELLQQPLRPYAPRNLTMGFEESDASGFDECLPSVAACDIETPAGMVHIPDHGEFWRLPCTVKRDGGESDGTIARLESTGTLLPLRFERTLNLEGEALRIDYKVENIGKAKVGYGWSAHPLFAVDEGDRIVLPASVSEVQVEGSAGERLGAKGAVHPWPLAKLADGGTASLDVAGSASDDIGDKLFAAAPVEGWAALERKRAGLQLRVEFDPAQSPYLGLWLCYGGWPEGQAERQHCVALEPCTAPVDSLAVASKRGWGRILAPGESFSWWMRIAVEGMRG